jgi:hypothetical protein
VPVVVVKLPDIVTGTEPPGPLHDPPPVTGPEAVDPEIVPLKIKFMVHVTPDCVTVTGIGTMKLAPSALNGAVPLVCPSLTVTFLPLMVIVKPPDSEIGGIPGARAFNVAVPVYTASAPPLLPPPPLLLPPPHAVIASTIIAGIKSRIIFILTSY